MRRLALGISLALSAGVTLVSLGATAADEACERCIDRFAGAVKAEGRVRHQIFVDAGASYRISLSPSDANADLIVAFDGHWPTDEIACRSAKGGTATDACSFEAKHGTSTYLFVLGRERGTSYDLRVEPAD